MNIFDIAYYTIKRLLRDKKSIVVKIITPIVAVIILGAALSGAFEPASLGLTEVGYVNMDEGEEGSKVVDKLSSIKEISDIVKFSKVESLEIGETMIKDKEISAIVVIEKDFTEKAVAGSSDLSLSVYSSKYSDYKMTVVKNVVDSYVNVINTLKAVDSIGGDISSYNYESTDVIKEVSLSSDGNRPRAIDYYAVTMLVMTLIAGAAYGCECIGEDYLGVIGKKIKSTPVKPSDQYIGKLLGICLANFMQGLIVMVFTKFALGVNWGNNIPGIIFIIFSISVLATALGAMVCILMNDVLKATSLVSLFTPIFTFIAGGYVKIDFGNIMYVSPNFIAQKAIFNSIYGGSESLILLCIGVMWVITFIAANITIIVGRRRTN